MIPLVPGLDLPTLVERAGALHAADVSDIVFIVIAVLSLLSGFVKNLSKTKQDNQQEDTRWREVMEERAAEARRRAAARKEAAGRVTARPSSSADSDDDWDEETWDEESEVPAPTAPAAPPGPRPTATRTAPAAPARAPVAATPVLDAQARVADGHLVRLIGEAESLGPRWQDAVARTRAVPALARAMTLADARFAPAVSDAIQRLRSARRKLGLGDPSATGAWAPLAVELRSLAAATLVVDQAARERLPSEAGAALSRLDRFAEALIRRIPGLARLRTGLLAARPVVLVGDRHEPAALALSTLDVLPLWVRGDVRNDPTVLAALAHEIGRAALAASPSLHADVRLAVGAPDRGVLPAGTGPIYVHDIEALLGSWYPTLFGDVFGVALLGPAYLSGFAAGAATAARLDRWTVIRRAPDGDSAAPEPPLRLRVAAAFAAAAALDGVDDELTRLRQAMPIPSAADAIQLPLRNGATIEAPASHFVSVVERAALRLLDAPLPSLGHTSVRQLPAPGWDGDLQFRATRATDEIQAGAPVDARPRIAIAAVLLRWEAHRTGAESLFAWLDGGSASGGAAEVGAGPAAHLGEALHRPSPALLAEAMAFRAVFDE